MTESPEPIVAARRTSPRVRFLVAFLASVIAVLAVGTGALYAYDSQYATRVLPGVRLEGVDLGGLHPDQARATLAEAYAAYGAGHITLTGPTGEHLIGYADIGRGPDLDAMVGAAMAAGRENGVARYVANVRTTLRGVTVAPAVTFDPARLDAALALVADAVRVEPSEASIAVDDGDFRITTSTMGRALDVQALRADLMARLASLDAPDELRVEIPLLRVEPVVDTTDVRAAKDAAERMAADLTLTHGDDTWVIPGSKLRPLISFSPTVDGGYTPVIDVAGIDPILAEIAADVERKPKSASYLIGRDGAIVGVTAGVTGRRLGVIQTRERIVDAILDRSAGATIATLEPQIVVRQPALTTAEAEQAAPLMKRISTWTTYFPIGEKNGFGANIWIPSEIINGYVVAPGETFDFWKAVGPVTREKGYRDGGAIINGRTEPQGALAGGICSCSTTLFNAALRAGFQMGARRNHYYYIDRYPLGLDATVFISSSGSRQTMSWTNDTEYPVLIRGVNTRNGSKGYVRFDLYSVPNGRKVVIGDPIVKNVRPASDSVEYTTSLAPGVRQRIEFPVDGKDVWRTVSVYENGKLLRRTTYYSHYARITGVVLVGAAQ